MGEEIEDRLEVIISPVIPTKDEEIAELRHQLSNMANSRETWKNRAMSNDEEIASLKTEAERLENERHQIQSWADRLLGDMADMKAERNRLIKLVEIAETVACERDRLKGWLERALEAADSRYVSMAEARDRAAEIRREMEEGGKY